jgi:UDP-N-acetylglucosamine 2-epimerase
MRFAAIMVGNSSSGLIEAPSFSLPVVNIGTRQDGRVRGANVIDVPTNRLQIHAAIEKALSMPFRTSLRGMRNPYDAGRPAGEIIIDAFRRAPPKEQLLTKAFHDLIL